MIESRYKGHRGVEINETTQLEKTAKIALDFLVRWGMVAAEPDGEDTSGRQKLRMLTPEELVLRSFGTAEVFMAEAKKRGHIHNSPSFKDMEQPDND